MLNIGKWFGYTYENKNAVPIGVIPQLTQDEIRRQLRYPIESKPDGYKSSQSSSVRFLENTNLNAK